MSQEVIYAIKSSYNNSLPEEVALFWNFDSAKDYLVAIASVVGVEFMEWNEDKTAFIYTNIHNEKSVHFIEEKVVD